MSRRVLIPLVLLNGYLWGCAGLAVYQRPKLLFGFAALLAYLGVELAMVSRQT